MLVLVHVVLPVFLIAGVAALGQRWLKLGPQSLSRATFYIFMPALVFNALVDADLGQSQGGRMALAVVLMGLLLWGAGAGVTRALGLRPQTRSAFTLATVMANLGNYGLPVIQVAFGEAGLVPAAIYLVLYTVLLMPMAIYIAAQGGPRSGNRCGAWRLCPPSTRRRWACSSAGWAGRCRTQWGWRWRCWPRRPIPFFWWCWVCNCRRLSRCPGIGG